MDSMIVKISNVVPEYTFICTRINVMNGFEKEQTVKKLIYQMHGICILIYTHYRNPTTMAEATGSKDSLSTPITMTQEIKAENSKEKEQPLKAKPESYVNEEGKIVMREYHPNGKLSHEHIGDADGDHAECKLSHESGILSVISIISIKNNTSFRTYFDKKSIKYSEVEIQNGMSERRYFNEQGIMMSRCGIDGTYQRHGAYCRFHTNGKVYPKPENMNMEFLLELLTCITGKD